MKNNFSFNTQQKLSMICCLDFVFNSEDTAFVLNGCAGVGKTAMIVELAKILENTHHVIVSSFTNRVVNSLKHKLHMNQAFITGTMTLHSLLYTAEVDNIGNLLYFRKNTKEEILTIVLNYNFTLSTSNSVLIVDESSMVSFEMLELIIDNFPGPVLFFGDNHQLPPVGCDQVNVMHQPNIDLRKICRVKKNNPIIQLSTEIRETGKYTKSKYRNLPEIEFTSKSNLNVEYLRENEFDIILCGTNKERKKMNRMRRVAHGYDPNGMPMEGEPLIFLERFDEFHRSHIVTVEETTVRRTIDDATYYEIKLKDGLICIYVTPEFLITENPEDNVLYDHYGNATTNPSMAPVAYAHAMTVHKAIGMEFDNVLFINDDVSYFLDQKKFTYTGVTRAKERITIAEKR